MARRFLDSVAVTETPHPEEPGWEMRLHAADIWVEDGAILTRRDEVRDVMIAAAAAGGATVLGEQFVSFPNGAFTGVLVLAQSHLSIHTWPELQLANVDLLSYGTLGADAIIDTIARGLGASSVQTEVVSRGVARSPRSRTEPPRSPAT
jgi:S-adenosylmethionine decarboxylase